MAGRIRLTKRSSSVSKITNRLKRLHNYSSLIEYENDVAKDLMTWASNEPNYNMEMVFSCLADLTDAHTKCIEQQCEKLSDFRQVFKMIGKEEIKLRDIEETQKQADHMVSNLQLKVARESRSQNPANFDSAKATRAKLEDAVNNAETKQKYLEKSKEDFEQLKAKSIRNALINFNNDYIRILSDMLTIYKTRTTISELLGEMPVYTMKELEPNLVDGNRVVKETLDALNMELPMRRSSFDRWQIHRFKFTVRSAPPSPTIHAHKAHHALRSRTPPPTRPPPQPSTTDQFITSTQDDEYDSFSSDEDCDYIEPVQEETDGLCQDEMETGYILPIATSPQDTRFPPGYDTALAFEYPSSPPPPPPGSISNGTDVKTFPEDPIYTAPHSHKLLPARPTNSGGGVSFEDARSRLRNIITNQGNSGNNSANREHSPSRPQGRSRDPLPSSPVRSPSPSRFNGYAKNGRDQGSSRPQALMPPLRDKPGQANQSQINKVNDDCDDDEAIYANVPD
ncbi:uncharacterized protein [Amphiura filiformis]|uniref:uncharacterized protein n=1 Tax=Amphiura filiformis TaxID=82378 RepID=UPI003B215CA8